MPCRPPALPATQPLALASPRLASPRLASPRLAFAQVRAVEERRAKHHPELRVASLYELAAMHAYAGLWPASQQALDALAEPIASRPVQLGAASAPSTMIMPNLGACVEYTGQSVEIDAKDTGVGEPSGSSYAPSVPVQVDALLEAVPKRAAAGLVPPDSSDVNGLCERPPPANPPAAPTRAAASPRVPPASPSRARPSLPLASLEARAAPVADRLPSARRRGPQR